MKRLEKNRRICYTPSQLIIERGDYMENNKEKENAMTGNSDSKTENDKSSLHKVDGEKLRRARAQREKIRIEERKIMLARKKVEEAEKQKATAKSLRETAERNVQKLKRQGEVLLRIAGRERERREHRRQWAVKGFFSIINQFNSPNESDFSRLCYAIQNTELIVKALLGASTYKPDSDQFVIYGKTFRRLISEEKAHYDADIAEARAILNMDVDTFVENIDNTVDTADIDSSDTALN